MTATDQPMAELRNSNSSHWIGWYVVVIENYSLFKLRLCLCNRKSWIRNWTYLEQTKSKKIELATNMPLLIFCQLITVQAHSFYAISRFEDLIATFGLHSVHLYHSVRAVQSLSRFALIAFYCRAFGSVSEEIMRWVSVLINTIRKQIQ